MGQQAPPPKRIAFARDRLIVGEVLLALLMAIFERHSRTLKRHFGSSLQTMAVGIAVLLSQLAEEPLSIQILAKALQIPRREIELELQELVDEGVLVKERGSYAANPELFSDSLEDARHVRRMRSIILGAAKKLETER
jgi:biotin operon repressor